VVAAVDDEQRIADGDLVAGREPPRRRQPFAVDERAVVAAEVLHLEGPLPDREPAVLPRHLAVDELQVGVGRPTQRRPLLDLEADPPLGPEQREQDRHSVILA